MWLLGSYIRTYVLDLTGQCQCVFQGDVVWTGMWSVLFVMYVGGMFKYSD